MELIEPTLCFLDVKLTVPGAEMYVLRKENVGFCTERHKL